MTGDPGQEVVTVPDAVLVLVGRLVIENTLLQQRLAAANKEGTKDA